MYSSQTNSGIGELIRPALASEAEASDVALSPWCLSRSKRFFDFAVAAGLLAGTWPIMVLAAIAIKLTSRGPVLFRQKRVGRRGRLFELMKFRSMRAAAERCGPGITGKDDPRILPLGRLLRKWKLDELPQLLNVLRGDMSLVGPRPDLPEFCASVAGNQCKIFLLRPGITGAATLRYRHEEEILAGHSAEEIRDYYIKHIYPDKITIDLEYARKARLSSDLQILFQTLGAIFS